MSTEKKIEKISKPVGEVYLSSKKITPLRNTKFSFQSLQTNSDQFFNYTKPRLLI
jgi:hypothetical protein